MCLLGHKNKRNEVHSMRIDTLSSTTQERIRDLLRPVLGEVENPQSAQMSQAELSRRLGINTFLAPWTDVADCADRLGIPRLSDRKKGC